MHRSALQQGKLTFATTKSPEQGGHVPGERYQHSRVVVESGEGCRGARRAPRPGGLRGPLGLGAAMSEAIIRTTGQLPLHDRGKVMIHILLLLAGGGESCADVEHLRAQRALFRDVCSESTLYRSLRALQPEVVAAVKEAVAGSGPTSGAGCPVSGGTGASSTSTLRWSIHSENKERTGPTYKGGFGFHPSPASLMPPARRWPSGCGRATPGPTTQSTWWCARRGDRRDAGRDRGRPSESVTILGW